MKTPEEYIAECKRAEDRGEWGGPSLDVAASFAAGENVTVEWCADGTIGIWSVASKRRITGGRLAIIARELSADDIYAGIQF